MGNGILIGVATETAPGERRVANAFISPALLADLAKGNLSFPAPLAAAFGLWDGGLRGSYRASIAASFLKSEGSENVANVLGGMTAWRAAGLPVTQAG